VNQRSALFRSTIPLGSNPGARKDRLQFGSSANELAARYGINLRTLGERSQSPMQRSTLMQVAYTCRPKTPLHAGLGQCPAGIFLGEVSDTPPFLGQLALAAYYEDTLGAPSAEAMQSALNALEARARFGRPELEKNTLSR
jgi:hypothetical protein